MALSQHLLVTNYNHENTTAPNGAYTDVTTTYNPDNGNVSVSIVDKSADGTMEAAVLTVSETKALFLKLAELYSL